MQPIENNILEEYTKYFNDTIDKFNISSQDMSNKLESDLETLRQIKNSIMTDFENFKPFMENFDKAKSDIEYSLKVVEDSLIYINKLVQAKQGISDLEIFNKYQKNINICYENINTILEKTFNILENKRHQQQELNIIRSQLKNLKIVKAKRDSFELQKEKLNLTIQKEKLDVELKNIENNINDINKSIKEIQDKKRPDIRVINSYLKVLNLPKYLINSEYQITISDKIIENENIQIVLSEGEKTTLAFAYFLARLKLFYNKNSLKDLVIIIDDPISSLDESRIYTTSYLVSKINQEIAGQFLKQTDEKAQVFVFTHNHVFMANIIRILGRYASYYQLIRDEDKLIFCSKDKVAGYFDTFYMLLFKEIMGFALDANISEDYDKALNNGNKIRILLESFMKTNFISQFIEKEYKQQSSFVDEILEAIIQKISNLNISYKFESDYFLEQESKITDSNDLKIKLDSIVKGLHLDSHGSIVDIYSQHKISLKEVQKFAKITINIMMALNPNQVSFYIEAAKIK